MAPQQETTTTIGPYRLREVLGEGGMGSVYRAEQTEPVQREVALKIIKQGLDTKEVVARFESERRALAVMDHSSIARVLDAGATESGRPYFVMELVRGVPITEYCDRHTVGTDARIELFIQVCDAVQHAHHKGVIHRDLKPSNVLVAVQDAKPRAKVIDFGIAKAVGDAPTDSTQMTALGQILGTPAYMSPEQAERSSLDVDTRTDVYSLGVMLYELLSGSLPFEREALKSPDFVHRYLLRDEQVPTPSARLSSLADTQETVARNRHTDVRTLRRELVGDLDWIVMKAMEKDRTRRYGTANDLASDLRRFLDGEPVAARPPSASYRLGKLARRHRGPIAAGIALLSTLTLGATGSAIGFVRAERNAERARAEASRAEAVNAFLDQMLRAADPTGGGGPSTTVQEVLDAAGAEVAGGALADQPLVEAAVRRSIGGAYLQLGLHEAASAHLDGALGLLETTPGADPRDRVILLGQLGELRREEADNAAAERLYSHALALADTIGLEADGESGERLVNGVRSNLGLLMHAMDRVDEAAVLLEALAASERRLLAPDDVALATTLNNLALVKRAQGDIDGAVALFEETLEVLRAAFGPSHVYVAAVLESIGSLEQYRGRQDAARTLMIQALEMRRDILGERHPDITNGLNGLGLLHVQMGELDAARAYLDEALAMSVEILGEEHTRTGSILNSVGLLHLARRDPIAAEAAFRRSVAIRERTLGERHRTTLNTNANLAAALVMGDRSEDAEALVRYVVGVAASVGLEDPALLGAARRTWGRALAALGRSEEAETQLLAAFDLQDAALGTGHSQTQRTVEALVELYETSGREEEMARWSGRVVVGS
jgi:serine/threonine protein kinase